MTNDPEMYFSHPPDSEFPILHAVAILSAIVFVVIVTWMVRNSRKNSNSDTSEPRG